jgi:hypothetical protein
MTPHSHPPRAQDHCLSETRRARLHSNAGHEGVFTMERFAFVEYR